MNVQECIEALHRFGEDPRGHCAEWTAALAETFPELKRVRGFVTLRTGLRRSHWWLETASGEIVDPTASQFDSEYFWHAGIAFYEPLNESEPEPTGKCPNCGESSFRMAFEPGTPTKPSAMNVRNSSAFTILGC